VAPQVKQCLYGASQPVFSDIHGIFIAAEFLSRHFSQQF